MKFSHQFLTNWNLSANSCPKLYKNSQSIVNNKNTYSNGNDEDEDNDDNDDNDTDTDTDTNTDTDTG